jgi:hypothetical protein
VELWLHQTTPAIDRLGQLHAPTAVLLGKRPPGTHCTEGGPACLKAWIEIMEKRTRILSVPGTEPQPFDSLSLLRHARKNKLLGYTQDQLSDCQIAVHNCACRKWARFCSAIANCWGGPHETGLLKRKLFRKLRAAHDAWTGRTSRCEPSEVGKRAACRQTHWGVRSRLRTLADFNETFLITRSKH